MSLRITREMGWGMAWAEFVALCPLDLDGPEDAGDVLGDALEAMGDEGLTVPEDVRRASWEVAGAKAIFDPRLLATTFSTDRDAVREVGRAADLFSFVMNPGGVTHVVLYPNLYYRARWHRRDDDLDHAFEMHRDGAGGDAEPREIVRFTRFNPYPFDGDLMLGDGTPVHPAPSARERESRSDLLPAVPAEIRWWATAARFLDAEGVDRLRPLIAQSWA